MHKCIHTNLSVHLNRQYMYAHTYANTRICCKYIFNTIALSDADIWRDQHDSMQTYKCSPLFALLLGTSGHQWWRTLWKAEPDIWLGVFMSFCDVDTHLCVSAQPIHRMTTSAVLRASQWNPSWCKDWTMVLGFSMFVFLSPFLHLSTHSFVHLGL